MIDDAKKLELLEDALKRMKNVSYIVYDLNNSFQKLEVLLGNSIKLDDMVFCKDELNEVSSNAKTSLNSISGTIIPSLNRTINKLKKG